MTTQKETTTITLEVPTELLTQLQKELTAFNEMTAQNKWSEGRDKHFPSIQKQLFDLFHQANAIGENEELARKLTTASVYATNPELFNYKIEEDLKRFIANLVIERLPDYVGESFDDLESGSDIAYRLMESDNVDGTMTMSTYKAKEFICRMVMNDELPEERDDFWYIVGSRDGQPTNPFDNPEGFMVSLVIYAMGSLLGQIELSEFEEDETLTQEYCDYIIQEIEDNLEDIELF